MSCHCSHFPIGEDRVGNALNAERQWRLESANLTASSTVWVGNALNAERQWRRGAQFVGINPDELVGNALNAERQWRRFADSDEEGGVLPSGTH